jgi:hypothetical protein
LSERGERATSLLMGVPGAPPRVLREREESDWRPANMAGATSEGEECGRGGATGDAK